MTPEERAYLDLLDLSLQWKRRTLEAELNVSDAIEVLEFYSNKNEWIDFKAYCPMKDGTIARVNSHFDFDQGAKARTLLDKWGLKSK